jgi:hypothetical protein
MFTNPHPLIYTKLSWGCMQNVCSKHYLPLIIWLPPALLPTYQTTCSSEKLVSIFIWFHKVTFRSKQHLLIKTGTNLYDYAVIPWRWKRHVPTKRKHPSTTLHSFVRAETDILVLLLGLFKSYSQSQSVVRCRRLSYVTVVNMDDSQAVTAEVWCK